MCLLWHPRTRLRGKVRRRRLREVVLQREGSEPIRQPYHFAPGENAAQGHSFAPRVSIEGYGHRVLQLLKQEPLQAGLCIGKAGYSDHPLMQRDVSVTALCQRQQVGHGELATSH